MGGPRHPSCDDLRSIDKVGQGSADDPAVDPECLPAARVGRQSFSPLASGHCHVLGGYAEAHVASARTSMRACLLCVWHSHRSRRRVSSHKYSVPHLQRRDRRRGQQRRRRGRPAPQVADQLPGPGLDGTLLGDIDDIRRVLLR